MPRATPTAPSAETTSAETTSAADAAPAVLKTSEVSEVMRYWLALMRYQEALEDRPRAQRRDANGAAPVINVAQPAPGQGYAKLEPRGREAFLVERQGQVELELDAEGCAFFEDWLDARYRRGEDADAERMGHLVCFPSVLSPRQELAGLVRSPASATWRSGDGKAFKAPSARDRRLGVLPEPPTRLLLETSGADPDEGLPFFVDTRLLRETLRVDFERIDAFFGRWRDAAPPTPRALIDALSALLEDQMRADGQLPEAATSDVPTRPGAATPTTSAPGASTPTASTAGAETPRAESAFQRLCERVDQRLRAIQSRSRAYPMALIFAANRTRATAHVQRDVQATLELLERGELRDRSALSRYLRGAAAAESEAPRAELLGRFSATPITVQQRAAAELSLSSTLSAVQGPPGTGKTTLILHLAAHALVQKVQPLLDGYSMGEALLVVTSTNNAAVDNVIDPLSGPDYDLPLALRVGSRDVTEKVTASELSRCKDFLSRHQKHHFSTALREFREARERLARAPADACGEPDDAVAFELFQAALRLRREWAIDNRKNLLNVLSRAIAAARGARSLRRVLEGRTGPWLRRLFPTWGCTLLSLGNAFVGEPGVCDRVVIDEAGQCHPGYAVSALLRARQALVIGDVHQLEPVIGLSRDDEARVARSARLKIDRRRLAPYRAHDESGSSAQSLADRAVVRRPTLVDHFRSQPEIAAICERLCGYGLVTHAAPSSLCDRVPELTAPVAFVSLEGSQTRHLGSWMNEREAESTLRWVRRLLDAGVAPHELGVITPFVGQLDLLFRSLRAHGLPIERHQRVPSDNLDLFAEPHAGAGIGVGTVHRFQGGERRVILLSTTLTRTSSLRFVDERVNLLNVAVSRARDHLITFGHEPTLRAGKHTPALLSGALRLDA